MPKTFTSGVPYFEHPSATRLQDLNWESVRVFVRLVRVGSFRKAAADLGMAVNTVRRQVEILEHDVGSPLVARGVTGVDLTAEGQAILSAALRMEEASFDVRRFGTAGLSQFSGTVRISVTEGIGTFWLMPRLVEFQRANPKLVVELNCTMRPSDPGRLESDIGIQISPPTNPDLKAVKLGRMHAMPFASPEYLQTYGRPQTLDDAKRHRIVEQLSPQLYNDKVDELFPDVQREGFVAVVTNTSTAHYWAVAKGAGLGMLPTYLWAIGARVEPVDLDLRTEFDIWMSYHPSTRATPRIAGTIRWLKDTFDPRLFPWFRDEFIHPSQFDEATKNRATPNLFDGFAGRTNRK